MATMAARQVNKVLFTTGSLPLRKIVFPKTKAGFRNRVQVYLMLFCGYLQPIAFWLVGNLEMPDKLAFNSLAKIQGKGWVEPC